MKLRNVILSLGVVMMAGSAFGQCRDPWVTEVYKQLKGRPPIGQGDGGECNPALYGSNWNSQDQLRSQMSATFSSLSEAGLQYKYEKVMSDLKFHTAVQAVAPHFYVGPRGRAPYADQAQTNGGTYWWHVPLPNDHVLVVARKCRRGWTSAGPGARSGCVQ